jgi:hypothetical protein
VESSRLVHISTEAIGKAMPATEGSNGEEGANEKDDEGENEKDDEGELPDSDERSVAKTRSPREGDGMLEVEELVKILLLRQRRPIMLRPTPPPVHQRPARRLSDLEVVWRG